MSTIVAVYCSRLMDASKLGWLGWLMDAGCWMMSMDSGRQERVLYQK